MESSPQQALSLYEADVVNARRYFLSSLDELPAALRVIARRRIHDRINRASPRPLLGEYAPWLIADILRINSVPSVQRITNGWLHIYFFTLMVDDLLDGIGEDIQPSDLIAGCLLFQRGLRDIYQDQNSQTTSIKHLDHAFIDTAEAALYELAASTRRAMAFSPPTPQAAGQKLAYLKVCTQTMRGLCSSDADTTGSAENIDKFIEELAIGIQLLDDITDLQEDLETGRLSYPLYLASQHFGKRLTCGASADDYLSHLVKSGALSETLREAVGALHSTLASAMDMGVQHENRATLYIRSLVKAAETALEVIIDIRKKQLVSGDSLTDKQQKQVRHALETIAQGS